MSSVKRVNGDYTILTINPGDTIAMQSTTVNIIGDLTVTGNASLTGNIAGDKIYNGTTSIEIQTVNGNANITVGGTSNVLVVANTGTYTTGLASVTGNVQDLFRSIQYTIPRQLPYFQNYMKLLYLRVWDLSSEYPV